LETRLCCCSAQELGGSKRAGAVASSFGRRRCRADAVSDADAEENTDADADADADTAPTAGCLRKRQSRTNSCGLAQQGHRRAHT